MNYENHLNYLRGLSKDEVAKKQAELIANTPEKQWPDGFPASIDPKLVIVGVSAGNSPDVAAEEGRQRGEVYFESAPSVDKSESSHFYYPDKRSYWNKIRYLITAFAQANSSSMGERDALAISTAINLGTGSAGRASHESVEELYVKWASKFINQYNNPDYVILIGLRGVLLKSHVAKWWSDGGLIINWRKPDRVLPFRSGSRKYMFRQWDVRNANNHTVRLIQWPNHPSRPPFANIEEWWRSVTTYLESDLNRTLV